MPMIIVAFIMNIIITVTLALSIITTVVSFLTLFLANQMHKPDSSLYYSKAHHWALSPELEWCRLPLSSDDAPDEERSAG